MTSVVPQWVRLLLLLLQAHHILCTFQRMLRTLLAIQRPPSLVPPRSSDVCAWTTSTSIQHRDREVWLLGDMGHPRYGYVQLRHTSIRDSFTSRVLLQ